MKVARARATGLHDIVTERINILAKFIGMFPFVRAFIMIIFFFTFVHRIEP